MKILAIETSCDETAIAIVEAKGNEEDARFIIFGNALLSQIEVHKEYGGVYPMLAKREHAKNLMPLLEAALEEAELLHENEQEISAETHDAIAQLLMREPELIEPFFEFVGECEPPEVDCISVTAGPGLEPALWVGINFAKALARVWNKSLIAVNHMEGHVLSALAEMKDEWTLEIKDVRLPVLALLISGGHTELVLMREWLTYELIGQTRDDAVGEAFDKVARMIGLPYPGGPEISKLAEKARAIEGDNPVTFPRPMINEDSCDFSFAGLKTAVLYFLKTKKNLTDVEKRHIARAFEDAAADVLWSKTKRALEETGAQTLVIGGGVSANTHIRRLFAKHTDTEFPATTLRIPHASLSTDNAVMIALSGAYHAWRKDFAGASLAAEGNLPLAKR